MKKRYFIFIILLVLISICSFVFFLSYRYYSNNDTIVLAVPYTESTSNIEEQSYSYLESIIKRFEQQNKGVSVVIEKIPLDEYSEWLSTSFIYSNAPDVFAVMPSNFHLLTSMSALENLNDLNFSQYIPQNIAEPWKIDGKQYAIPYETNPSCIVLNKNLIIDKHVTLNASNFDWMDMFYVCKFFTYDKDKDGVNDHFGVTNVSWESLVYSNGQKLFDYSLFNSNFDNSNVEFAIKYAIEMNRLNLSSLPDSFEKGLAVMKVTNLAQARYYIKHYPNFDLEIYPFPKGPDGEFLAEPYDTPLAINAKSKHKDLAHKLLEFIVLDYDNQLSLFENSYSFPVLEQVQTSQKVISSLEPYIREETLQKIVHSETISIDFPEYYQLMNIADKEIFQYIKYELDIKTELKMLNETITSLLKALNED